MFIAQVLVGPRKQLKQIIQTEHNIVKNSNWPEANQLAIYKLGRGFELGSTEKQIQVVVRTGLEPGTAGVRVRLADRSATLPPTHVAWSHVGESTWLVPNAGQHLASGKLGKSCSWCQVQENV